MWTHSVSDVYKASGNLVVQVVYTGGQKGEKLVKDYTFSNATEDSVKLTIKQELDRLNSLDNLAVKIAKGVLDLPVDVKPVVPDPAQAVFQDAFLRLQKLRLVYQDGDKPLEAAKELVKEILSQRPDLF